MAEPPARPNIVHIGLGWTGIGDLGCYGSPIPTPHLDALAASGVRFSRFTTSPIDYYAHAENFTGHSVWSFIYDGHPQLHKPVAIQIPQLLLRDAGYHLYFGVGGWQAQRQDLDRLIGVKSPRLIRYEAVEKDLQAWDGKKPLYINWSSGINNSQSYGMGLGRIEKAVPAELLQNMDKLFVDAQPKDIAEKIYARQVEMGLYPANKGWVNPFAKQPPFPPKIKEMACYRECTTIGGLYATYAALIHTMDSDIGKLVAWLKERGQYDNTLFILSGESGAHSGHGRHGLAWSQVSATPFVGDTREMRAGGRICPLILLWPKNMPASSRNTIVHSFVSTLDLVPTILEAAQVKYPATSKDNQPLLPLTGRSLLPALSGKLTPTDEYYITADRGSFRGVYGEKWSAWAPLNSEKLDPRTWHLYDLSNDPFERTNVVAKHPEVVEQLFAKWKAWDERFTILHPGIWREKSLAVEALNEMREKAKKK